MITFDTKRDNIIKRNGDIFGLKFSNSLLLLCKLLLEYSKDLKMIIYVKVVMLAC